MAPQRPTIPLKSNFFFTLKCLQWSYKPQIFFLIFNEKITSKIHLYPQIQVQDMFLFILLPLNGTKCAQKNQQFSLKYKIHPVMIQTHGTRIIRNFLHGLLQQETNLKLLFLHKFSKLILCKLSDRQTMTIYTPCNLKIILPNLICIDLQLSLYRYKCALEGLLFIKNPINEH